MRRLRLVPPALCLLAVSLLALTPQPASPQQGNAGQPVQILTVDGVELSAHFYPSSKGKDGRTVMLLHAFDEDSKKGEWLALARVLNEKGYAVIRFDFRGHGDSTTVKPGVPDVAGMGIPGFWDHKENQFGIKGFKLNVARKSTIDAKQFNPGYQTVLVNDIAAVKGYLDQKNDESACNSANLILIGAKEGATLGALWLNSEYNRYRLVLTQQQRQVADLANPEGAAVTACVWLTISGNLAPNYAVPVSSMLYKAGTQHKVPMMFFYGPSDSKGKQVALACEKKARGAKKDYPFTMTSPVPKGEKYAGSGLLLKSLKTDEAILQYLDIALNAKNPSWKMRVLPNATYVWRNPSTGQPQPAKLPMADNVLFSDYRAFAFMR